MDFEAKDIELFVKNHQNYRDLDADFISFRRAAWNILKPSLPSIFGLVFQMLVEIVNLIFIGNLNDPVALAGVGLGNMLINMICFSIGMGLNGAIDTLVSQAYGDKEYYLWGCYLNRGRIIQALFFALETTILMFTKEILLILGQSHESSEAARIYVISILPGMFAMSQFETVRRYLQAMGNYNLSLYIQSTTSLLHILWSYVLVSIFDFGLIGSAISTCLTYWINLIVITLFLKFKKNLVPLGATHAFNSDSLKNWPQYLKFGVPSALMMWLEWWGFEVLSIFSGWLSVEELSANIILINMTGFLFNFSLGISYVAGNLVGNSLGEIKPNKAKKYFTTSLILVSHWAVFIIIFVNIFKSYIPLIYTQQQDVVDNVIKTLPAFSIMIFFDYLQGVEAGSLKAIGYQTYGFIVCLVGYWVFTVPCAYLFAFHLNLRIVGIWIGVPIGSMFTAISFAAIIFSINWNKLAANIQERIQAEKQNLTCPLIAE